jgi:hypothetical protein
MIGNEQFPSLIKYYNYIIFYLEMIHLPYMYNAHSKFINCSVLIIYQVKIHKKKSSKCLAPKSIHAWAYMTIDLHSFSKVPGQMQKL